MKLLKYIAIGAFAVAAFSGCNDEPELITSDRGPTMEILALGEAAQMGGKVSFEIRLTDNIPLSTLKATLYYDQDAVSNVTIRTKTEGTYTGEIDVPFFKEIPDGNATLLIQAQNIQFGLTTTERKVAVTRPDFDHLTYVLGDEEYTMTRTAPFQYEVTDNFPQKPKGYIKSPETTDGTVINFGWEDSAVKVGSKSAIPFTNSNAGVYTITFNTLTYEASPFTKLLLNGTEMTMVDDDNYKVTAKFTKGQSVAFSGIADFDEWIIDSDFFAVDATRNITFAAISGNYSITANFKHKYLRVEAGDSNGDAAVLAADGSGAIWLIGNGFTKPSMKNKVGWEPNNALCLAPIAAGKYQITGVAGLSLDARDIDFKFFYQKGWGSEYGDDKISTTSDIIYVGDGKNGHDKGNIGIVKGTSLDMGGVYRFTVDVTAGVAAAVLTCEKIGEQVLPASEISFAGVAMTMADADNYSGVVDLTQGQSLSILVDGVETNSSWYANVDYVDNNKFVPVSGKYNVKLSGVTGDRYISFGRLTASGDKATTNADGSGGIYIMAWGLGYPSLSSQFGWNPGAAYSMAEVSPKVYRLTGKAGPEKGSSIGQVFRFDYLSFKFFCQDGWGEEFNGPLDNGAKAFLSNQGNLELASGVQLETDATYVLTVDLTGGKAAPIVKFQKK